ncbi:MAG: hypothetical protein CFE46_11230 [Burkholderiales bacterium PBB6]|nr:MAG: hypothetical protein CFE46_11230 [Burkholderiales bacterium PBB6]
MFAAAMVQTAAAEVDGKAFTRMAGFELGVGRLTEIQRQLGPSAIQKTGDAGEYEERLCYLVSAGTVSFLAGEVGGSNNLSGFELTSKRLSGCGRWPARIPQPKLSIAGVYVGMPMSRFVTVVPTAKRIEDGRLIGGFESKLPYTQGDLKAFSPGIRSQIARGEMQSHWDVVVSVAARFEHLKLTEVRVWKTVTN